MRRRRSWSWMLGLAMLAAAPGGSALGCGESGSGGAAPGASAGSGGAPPGGSSAGQGSGTAGGTSGGNAGGAGGIAGTPATSGGSPNAGQAGSGAGRAGEAAAGAAGGGGLGGDPLVIYWIDVEGGAATLLIAPSGDIVVVDAGNPGSRDAQRIATVLQEELQADHIDHMITTHYHGDHVGGVPVLAGLLPVSKFYDHGPSVQNSSAFDAYVQLAGN